MPFVAAVQTNEQGHPVFLRFDPVAAFSGREIAAWSERVLSAETVALSDGQNSSASRNAGAGSASLIGSTLILWNLLPQRLVRWAKGRKLQRLYGDVFEHNNAMLSLAESLGFRRERAEDAPGLTRVVLILEP